MWPDVVVQLPVYNEPAALVARALDAALALDYPGRVTVQLLDDSSPTAQAGNAALCAARPRVRHRARTTREGFKAGALAGGLAASDAPLAAIFDVDFRPSPDTLRRLVPALLSAPDLAFVQARWTHPDSDFTPLGRAQAALLDLHFAVEQAGRDRLGLPITFNGTAGVWRRAAIEAGGGWQGDTLAEDLDLALRVQVAGWRARFLETVTVPADLPGTLSAWRTQQSRWTQGLTEVGRKLLGRVWRSDLSWAARASVTAQIAMAGSLPALLVVIVLHPVLASAAALGVGPGMAYFTALSAGYLALVGALGAHLAAQRACYPNQWGRRLAHIPLALAAPLALVAPCSRAALDGLRGRHTSFVRTPKQPGLATDRRGLTADLVLAAYSAGGVAGLALLGAWPALWFQSLFALGLLVVVVARIPRAAARHVAKPTQQATA